MMALARPVIVCIAVPLGIVIGVLLRRAYRAFIRPLPRLDLRDRNLQRAEGMLFLPENIERGVNIHDDESADAFVNRLYEAMSKPITNPELYVPRVVVGNPYDPTTWVEIHPAGAEGNGLLVIPRELIWHVPPMTASEAKDWKKRWQFDWPHPSTWRPPHA